MKEDIKYFNRIFYPILSASVALNTYCLIKDSSNNKSIDKSKQRVLIKDYNKCDSMQSADTAERAYFEGFQMVRDSLKRRDINGI